MQRDGLPDLARGRTRSPPQALAHPRLLGTTLAGLPILANVDTGHTSPMTTLPIGGQVAMSAEPGDAHLVLTQH